MLHYVHAFIMFKHVNFGKYIWIHRSKIKNTCPFKNFIPGWSVYTSFFHPGVNFYPCFLDRILVNGFFFLSLCITFRVNVWISIIPYPCSFFFALRLEWSLNISFDKKPNAISISANLCPTLFSLRFKFSSACFYLLSKCTTERGIMLCLAMYSFLWFGLHAALQN